MLDQLAVKRYKKQSEETFKYIYERDPKNTDELIAFSLAMYFIEASSPGSAALDNMILVGSGILAIFMEEAKYNSITNYHCLSYLRDALLHIMQIADKRVAKQSINAAIAKLEKLDLKEN